MLHFCCGEYTVSASVGTLPLMYSTFVEDAVLHEDLGIHSDDGTVLFFAVQSSSAHLSELVVALRFRSGAAVGFHPGFLLIPESRLILVGAGERLLAYELSPPRRLWEDATDFGFWRWRRHGDIVLMSGEVELAAWDINGRKLWSTFVEPPWFYEICGDRVNLDVMGRKSSFIAAIGPSSSESSSD